MTQEQVKGRAGVLRRLEREEGVPWLLYSPDGQILAAMAWDGRASLWNVKTGKILPQINECRTLAFSRSGSVLAMSTEVGPGVPGYGREPPPRAGLHLLAMPGLTRLRALEEPFVYPDWLAFSPNGKTLAGDLGDTLVLWDAASGRKERVVTPRIDSEQQKKNWGAYVLSGYVSPYGGATPYSIAYSADGKILAQPCSDGTLWLWNTTTWDVQTTLRLQRPAACIAFSPGGKFLAVAGCPAGPPQGDDFGGREPEAIPIELWDTQGDKPVRTLASGERNGEPVTLRHPSFHGVNVSFSADGKLLATSGYGSDTLKLWDVSTGQTRLTVQFGRLDTCFAVFSPVGNTLAVAHRGAVELWDVAKLLAATEARQ